MLAPPRVFATQHHDPPGEGELMGAFLVQEGLLLATWWVEAVGYRGDWFDGSSPKIKNMPPPPIGSVVL